MARPKTLLLLPLILAACGGDPRREHRLDGEWEVHLTLDAPYHAARNAVRPLRDTLSGVIYVAPQFPDFPEWAPVPDDMRPYAVGRYFIDFSPFDGKEPRPDSVRPRPELESEGGSWHDLVAHLPRGDSVYIGLTPRVSDAGYGLFGRLRGDTLAGAWEAYGYGGTVSRGRFRMWRRPRGAAMDSAIAYARRGAHRRVPPPAGTDTTLAPVAVPLPAAGDTATTAPRAAPR